MSTLYFNFSVEIWKNLFDFWKDLVYTLSHGGEAMTARQIVEMATGYCGVSNSELARRLGWSPQLLNKRLNTGKFTVEEWEKIGEALGATARVRFKFSDGTEIWGGQAWAIFQQKTAMKRCIFPLTPCNALWKNEVSLIYSWPRRWAWRWI